MWLILLEALIALAVLVAIVWWTMFSGRRRGELVPPPPAEPERPAAPHPPGDLPPAPPPSPSSSPSSPD